ncbi:60S ribosomal export protein NMD3 [Aeropyrum pernix]|uniref:60S ribosomal export protein NMD3 n=1 Tax=Aeropyrum pernix TaxID=56636 RepID=UPI001037DD42|nr:60S ribosomal export protein NMD3 [Aeropyrum pernix]
MAGVCPSCGRTLEGSGVRRLCPDCYVERYGVARIPEAVRFVYCRDCGAYRYQGGWNEGLESVEGTLREYLHMVLTVRMKPTEAVEEAWVESIELMQAFDGPGVYTALVTVAGRAGGQSLVERKIITVEASQALCPRCTARSTGRGFEAEVKVRSTAGSLGRDVKTGIARVLRRSRSIAGFVVKVDENREGLDIYLTDQTAARILAGKLRSEFSAEVKESYKLVGRQPSGRRKGRLTISVRIPEYRPGELISVEGRPHLYLGRSGRGLVTIDLDTGRERVVDTSRTGVLAGVKRYEPGARLRRMMLLSSSGDSMVFLDVDKGMQEVVDAPRGSVRSFVESMEPGRVYEVFIHGGRIYVLRETG